MRLLITLLSIVVPFSVCVGQGSEKVRDPKSRFEELAARYDTLSEQYWAHTRKEGEDETKRFLEKAPMNTTVSDFLELEEQSRGTAVGFSCLYHLVRAAGSVPDADNPATAGKVAALKVLAKHYHDYPDVDTTFLSVFYGPRVPESKMFLRNLLSATQLDYVRANAMYELANYLASEANLLGTLQSHLAVIDREDPENAARLKRIEKLTTSLEDVDVARNRSESLMLIEQLSTGYKDELVPPRVAVRNPGLVSVKRNEIDEVLKSKRKHIVDLLPAIRFELNHSIGKKAAPIDGKDATGKAMSLTDFNEKVVVVMFSFKGCGPCEGMYPDNRKLIEDLSGEPFVFVGVQGDETIDTVHESLESKTISWRVWWDGKDKRISDQWNIREWPSIFVIDQRGVIRFRDVRGKELENAVRSLLKKHAE